MEACEMWRPCGTKAFRPYVVVGNGDIRVNVKRPLVARLTNDIVRTLQNCNPDFKYSEALKSKRYLTNPSIGMLNDGHDNGNSDLILHVNFVLVNLETKRSYIVKDILGQGSFGQVAKCWDSETNSYVAVKIIKNRPAYYGQALVEVEILKMLNQKFDPHDQHHIVRILDHFVCHHHLCIAFEMLGWNLFELIDRNGLKGLPVSLVQIFSKQILHALVLMKDAGIIHCDLKPENILMHASLKCIKVIDFGSACMERQTVYSYIQSRHYRSPEVLLGHPYTSAIDMWSFGCVVAELFLGLPLFPGTSEYDLLKRMIEILSTQPPDDLLGNAKRTSKFFKYVGNVYGSKNGESCTGVSSAYHFLTREEYKMIQKESKGPPIGKHYFPFVKLEDIISHYPYRTSLPEKDVSRERVIRRALVDFLRGLLEFDPEKRWSPLQASRHPFITGEPFTSPYKPSPETPRIPFIYPVSSDHNPGGSRSLAANVSPQVGCLKKSLPHNSPCFAKASFSYDSSFGSLGSLESHGSCYNDDTRLGSSYGSCGNTKPLLPYYSPLGPSGLNLHTQIGGSFFGSIPDTTQRQQFFHGNTLDLSPGSFGCNSLGVNLLTFTPPSTQMQVSTASPASGGVYGSQGKACAVGKNRKKKNSSYPIMPVQHHENASQHGMGHYGEGISASEPDAQHRDLVGSHSSLSTSGQSNWRESVGDANGLSSYASSTSDIFPASYAHEVVSSQLSDALSDRFDWISIPDPADWDPNYSDETFLQEDNSEDCFLSSKFGGGIRLNNTVDAAIPTIVAGGSLNNRDVHTTLNYVSPYPRTEQPFPASSLGEINLSTYHHDSGNSHYLPQIFENNHSSHGTRAGYSHSNYSQQNFSKQFGWPSTRSFNHMNSNFIYSGKSNQNGHVAYSNDKVTDLHSSAAMLGNKMPWGQRKNPAATSQPSSFHHRRI